MPTGRHTPEEITNRLREAEVVVASGSTVVKTGRRIRVSEQTFYRWRSEYDGTRVDQTRHLKQLDTENGRLKRAVAERVQDLSISLAFSRGPKGHSHRIRWPIVWRRASGTLSYETVRRT